MTNIPFFLSESYFALIQSFNVLSEMLWEHCVHSSFQKGVMQTKPFMQVSIKYILQKNKKEWCTDSNF